MPISEFIGVKGSGVYFPRRKVSVEKLAKEFRVNPHGISKEHGIQQIHVSSKDETEFFMAIQATKQALSNANLSANEIDLVIYCKALTKKNSALSYSSRIIEYINAKDAYGFDIDAGFIGGLIGMHVANDIIKNSFYMKNAIVIAAQEFDEMYLFGGAASRIKHLIFGDGAAAVILSKNTINNKILASNFIIDHYTKFVDELLSQEYQDKTVISKLFQALDIMGVVKNIKNANLMSKLTNRWVENAYKAVASCLDSVNLDMKDVDHLVKTQLSIKETNLLAEKLKIENSRIYNAAVEKGHLGHADILSNLHLTFEQKELQNLDIIVLVAANYDCSSGALVLRR